MVGVPRRDLGRGRVVTGAVVGADTASVAHLFGRAVAWHRQAVSFLLAAEAELRRSELNASADADAELRRWVTLLHDLARSGLPGWLGAPLDASALELPLGRDAAPDRPMYLRVGDAEPTPDSCFCVVAPFVGAGHLAIDADVRDPAVAAWLSGVLLRTTAALPHDALRVLPVDGASLGSAFAAFRAMVDAQLWSAPATDLAGWRATIREAEGQISAVQAGEVNGPPVLLLAVAAIPAGTGWTDWARLAAVARAGPAARVHLLVAGWPPDTPPGTVPPGLEHTTQLTAVGNGWYRISEPLGAHRVSDDSDGLVIPMRLDTGATEAWSHRWSSGSPPSVFAARRTEFAARMPTEIWQESSAAGLSTPVGRDGPLAFTLALTDTTPQPRTSCSMAGPERARRTCC